MTPAEEVFHLQSNRRLLLATFHQAQGDARRGLLFIHPFGEEKKCAHRAFVETARALASHGIASLRFDLSGCGDSEGSFADARFSDWLDDIESAWKELTRRLLVAPCGILGLRMGASLASNACARLNRVAALCLWQPVVHGQSEFTAELRRVLIQQMITLGRSTRSRRDILDSLQRDEGEIELDGYPVTGPLYRDICAVNLIEDAHAWPQSVVIAQFSRQNQAIRSLAQQTDASCAVVHVQPIWIRSDFMPTRETGEQLARECVLPVLNATGEPK